MRSWSEPEWPAWRPPGLSVAPAGGCSPSRRWARSSEAPWRPSLVRARETRWETDPLTRGAHANALPGCAGARRVWTVREGPMARMTHSRPGQRRIPRSRLPLWLAALVSFLPVAGFGGVRLESRARDRVITIDGKADEWQESTTVIERAQIAVALFNDRDDLYVCIKSWNEDLNFQAMNLGLTVWFDPDGGK